MLVKCNSVRAVLKLGSSFQKVFYVVAVVQGIFAGDIAKHMISQSFVQPSDFQQLNCH